MYDMIRYTQMGLKRGEKGLKRGQNRGIWGSKMTLFEPLPWGPLGDLREPSY